MFYKEHKQSKRLRFEIANFSIQKQSYKERDVENTLPVHKYCNIAKMRAFFILQAFLYIVIFHS